MKAKCVAPCLLFSRARTGEVDDTVSHTDKELISARQVNRIAIHRERSLGLCMKATEIAVRNGTGVAVSLVRGERGQKERDERA